VKVAFVVQRYGQEVVGGAEHICRRIAEHLHHRIELEVLTTCAVDYVTWTDQYPPGKEQVNGVTVLRFVVDSPRDIRRFDQLSETIVGGNNTPDLQDRWMRAQGPYSTQLLSHLVEHSNKYDLIVFFTYLYATTYFGLDVARAPAILVPFAHEEPWIHFGIFRRMFQIPKGFVFQTEEERDLVSHLFGVESADKILAGAGVDEPAAAPNSERFWRAAGATLRQDTPLALYLGRVDPSKGCDSLLDYFARFRRDVPELPIQLALVGTTHMEIQKTTNVAATGPIYGDARFDAICAADVVINPSPHESLSLVLLESWLLGRPVLVNGACSVLRGQCLRSNGGLYYERYEEFREALRFLLEHRAIARQIGAQGQQYVLAHYRWSLVADAYMALMQQVAVTHPTVDGALSSSATSRSAL
jgi:glycosyltransferase involved in cell wall biosynthesis